MSHESPLASVTTGLASCHSPTLSKRYVGEKVLVTGGAGFIGSHLVEALLIAGARVRVLDSMAQARPDSLRQVLSSLELWEEDVRDEKAVLRAVNDCSIVFHLAANASVPRSVQNPREDFECNALGTLNLLQAVKSNPVTSCVVVSSGAVYGQPVKFPIQEEDALLPISPYGASKMAAEGVCRAFHASYGLPVQIARVFNTYGPRQPRFVMYDFYRKLKADPSRLEVLGNGRQIRDFCYVSDTVDGLLRLGTCPAEKCEAFNISSGLSYSVTEVAKELFLAMGLNEVEISYSGSSWSGDAQRWEVSIEKLARLTGYSPRYSLRDGLKEFVTWFSRCA